MTAYPCHAAHRYTQLIQEAPGESLDPRRLHLLKAQNIQLERQPVFFSQGTCVINKAVPFRVSAKLACIYDGGKTASAISVDADSLWLL